MCGCLRLGSLRFGRQLSGKVDTGKYCVHRLELMDKCVPVANPNRKSLGRAMMGFLELLAVSCEKGVVKDYRIPTSPHSLL